jgi:hypothetical protein|tara:strand:+ start:308 stop:562 length:255 start_codon:yes stop_codon:yes gene_type:complete
MKELTIFIAVSDCGGWGRSKDAKLAIKNAVSCSHIGGKVLVHLYKAHPDTEISDMDGTLSFPSPYKPLKVGIFNRYGKIQNITL